MTFRIINWEIFINVLYVFEMFWNVWNVFRCVRTKISRLMASLELCDFYNCWSVRFPVCWGELLMQNASPSQMWCTIRHTPIVGSTTQQWYIQLAPYCTGNKILDGMTYNVRQRQDYSDRAFIAIKDTG